MLGQPCLRSLAFREACRLELLSPEKPAPAEYPGSAHTPGEARKSRARYPRPYDRMKYVVFCFCFSESLHQYCYSSAVIGFTDFVFQVVCVIMLFLLIGRTLVLTSVYLFLFCGGFALQFPKLYGLEPWSRALLVSSGGFSEALDDSILQSCT